MIDFSTLQGLSIPEGVVTQITDASGRVLWAMLSGGGSIVLGVEKISSDTYAGETTYTAEEFILLDIYPKTNGTVNVTYGGLTKTITDTSGAENPNAQQVFFGTFNGVSDSIATPLSGELTIDGDCVAFACSAFDNDEKTESKEHCSCITGVTSLGKIEHLPPYCISSPNDTDDFDITIPTSVKHIEADAFHSACIENLYIPSSVESISGAFYSVNHIGSILVDDGNAYYSSDGLALFNKNKTRIISFPVGVEGQYVIPSSVDTIGNICFGRNTLAKVTVPTSVKNIEDSAFYAPMNGCVVEMLSTSPPTIGENVFYIIGGIVVHKGYSDVYKSADGWSEYADKITEAS